MLLQSAAALHDIGTDEKRKQGGEYAIPPEIKALARRFHGGGAIGHQKGAAYHTEGE